MLQPTRYVIHIPTVVQEYSWMHLPQVASSFPWTPGASLFAHPMAVHNSVLGVRQEALAAGAGVQLVGLNVGVEDSGEECTDRAVDLPLGDPPSHEGGVRRMDMAAAATAAGAWGVGEHWRVKAEGSPVWGCGSGSRGGGAVGGSCSSAAVQDGGGSAAGGGGGAAPALHLLALPAECNFTGDRLPLERLVASVRERGVVGAGEAVGAGDVVGAGDAVGTCGAAAAAVGEAAHGQQQQCRAYGGGEGAAGPSGMGAKDGHVQAQPQQSGKVEGAAATAGERASATAAAGAARDAQGRWMVLLDAAKACSTRPPDLTAVRADFVVLSYYKIFGHPTGLGALVVRRDALALLAGGKRYFGGGTVEVAVADRPYYVRYVRGCDALCGSDGNGGDVDGWPACPTLQ